MPQTPETIVLSGGLDLVTPAIAVQPGMCIAAQNYESEARGYRRAQGFERLDGRGKPSQASYWVMAFDSGSTAIMEGDTVTGATSGATGIALYDATATSGTWGGGDAAGEIILYDVTGTFIDDEGLEVSASNVATADGAAVQRGAETDDLSDTYTWAAIEKRRAAIGAVPGSGAILGVCTYGGAVYAFRNNAGGTAAVMHKATSSGWVAQSFGSLVRFNSGATAFAEGETLTGGTSGATATIQRVIKQSGAWDGSGAGYMVLSGVSGTYQAAEAITSSSGSASAVAAQSSITLPPGGKYRTEVHNFYGVGSLTRLYGVNGEGYAFEWDGTVLAPIRTGLSAALDKPTHIAVISEHLLLGYDGGSILVSSTGLPLVYDAVSGAAEFGFGQDITGMKSSTKTAVVITGRTKIGYLQGTSVADFVLSDVSEDSGAVPDTLEVIGEPHFLDDQGIRSLSAADTFGNWSVGTITQRIEPLIKSKRINGIEPVGVMRVRAKDQYRMFYPDGTGISIYFGRQSPEMMAFYFPLTPTAVHSGRDASGQEILLAGADDGFVYQVDSGTSADGDAISAYIRFSFMNQGAPMWEKRYHRAFIDVSSAGSGSLIYYASEFSYGDPSLPSGSDVALSFKGGGGFWDTAFWDNFYWDASVQGQGTAELDGIGSNVSIAFMSDAVHEEPHTLSSLTINYTPRRKMR